MIDPPVRIKAELAHRLSPERRNTHMADLAHHDRLQRAFDGLLQDLSATWPKQDLDYVREELRHDEYGDALENLIALGLRNGAGFGPDQARQVESLAAAMEMEGSPFLAQLRETGGRDASGGMTK